MMKLWSDEVEERVVNDAHSIDGQKTPKNVQFCKRCVISNQRPRIVFDKEGICSACRYAERKHNEINWGKRNDALAVLLDNHRKDVGYDVIVPCSGGKDSGFVAHRLKETYGMHPLCVKWAPFIYTDTGKRNLEDFSQSGFDVWEFMPSGLLHRKLARLALEYVGDPFLPFIYGQLSYPMNVALDTSTPLVMFGENGEAEYGGDPSANDKPCWSFSDWDKVYLKGASVSVLLNIGHHLGVFSDEEIAHMSRYYHLPDRGLMEHVEFHWFSYYEKWHPQSNYYYACENTGFEANDQRSEGTYSKYASIDDKLDGLHYFMGFTKFGIGRCTSDAAHEIRDGDITREEAVALVHKYDGEFPERYLKESLEYLGMTAKQFAVVIERFRPPHLWKGGDLLHRVA